MQIKDHMPFAYAHRLAQKIGSYLKKRYGATKVMIAGSLAMGCYNPDFSDIDVYFEGVREELVADVMADCRRNFGERDSAGRKRIDYICASQLSSTTKQEIVKRGSEV